MLCIKTEVKASKIPNAGKGLFSLQFAPKGSIVSLPISFSPKDKVFLEKQYPKELITRDEFPFNAAVRWGGDYFYSTLETPDNSDYINHSNHPNLLSCLRFFFALDDIHCGDELTLDYRYLEFAGEGTVITSEQEKIIGLSPKEALLQSAQKLINLLNEVEDIHCFDLPYQPD